MVDNGNMRLPRPSLLAMLVVPTIVLIALFAIVQCDVSHSLRATQDEATDEL